MPAIPAVVDRIEDVPEAARPYYTQRDGKFVIDTTVPVVPQTDLTTANAKIVEFRDNNIRLTQEVTELRPLKDKFKDIDPEAARAALAAQAALAGKGITKVDDVQTMITAAVTAAVKPVQDSLTAITASAAAEREKNAELMLRSKLSDKFIAAGGVPEALSYMLQEAKPVFVVQDGEVKAGPNRFSADRPGEPLSMDEWLTAQMKTSAFAFKPSAGGGANPAAPGAPALKPGQTILKDPTPQQLGAHAKDIKEGKIKVEYST